MMLSSTAKRKAMKAFASNLALLVRRQMSGKWNCNYTQHQWDEIGMYQIWILFLHLMIFFNLCELHPLAQERQIQQEHHEIPRGS